MRNNTVSHERADVHGAFNLGGTAISDKPPLAMPSVRQVQYCIELVEFLKLS